MSSPYHFDAPDADVILRSSEQCPAEFRLHKCILAAASPFFRDMFSLPQPPCLPQDGLPVIPVPEPHSTLSIVLRFVYPVPDPRINTLDELIPILEIALKYDFLAVISTLRNLLVSPQFVETAPIRVFAIACRYDFDFEAKIASRYTLQESILDGPICDELKHITAYSYHQLLDLHRRRARAAQDLLKPRHDLKCAQCNIAGHGAFGSPKWWHEFETRARAELAVRPTTNVIFKMGFLAQACAAGCPRCPSSLLESSTFLSELKSRIDELPATI